MRKTKIVCTLGPATDDEAILRKLILSGMNVARLNMSHGKHEEHKRRADMVKKLRRELDVPVAILLDTKGPEIRTGTFEKPVMLEYGQKYTLTTFDRPGDSEGCSISFKKLPEDISIGVHILVDDGLIEMIVESVTDTEIECRVLNGGTISSYKGINVPGVTLSMPYISERDKADLAFGVQEDVDFIAASFTRCADDIVLIRNELENNGCRNIRIIAKIENTDGVENIDDIIRVSDGIMVARGDLGVEIPMEDIPVIQKRLIHKAYAAGKQVITATQMLDSMIKNRRPTSRTRSTTARARSCSAARRPPAPTRWRRSARWCALPSAPKTTSTTSSSSTSGRFPRRRTSPLRSRTRPARPRTTSARWRSSRSRRRASRRA